MLAVCGGAARADGKSAPCWAQHVYCPSGHPVVVEPGHKRKKRKKAADDDVDRSFLEAQASGRGEHGPELEIVMH